MKVKVKKLRADAKLPEYATIGSACFDLALSTEMGDGLHVYPDKPTLAGTGLSFEIPAGHVMLIFPRSGLAHRRGIRLSNCVAVIDSDYRGEVYVSLASDRDVEITVFMCGDRIAQAMILPVDSVQFDEVDFLSPTIRGDGGFGSTGA